MCLSAEQVLEEYINLIRAERAKAKTTDAKGTEKSFVKA